jgi:hypothetical protein
LLAVWLGSITSQARRLKNAIAAVRDARGFLYYDWQIDKAGGPEGSFPPGAQPPGPDWLRDLIGDEYFVNVLRVYLQDAPFDDDDAATLTAMPTVEWLILDGTKITDDGMKHLSRLRNLTRLGLSGTNVGDQGLVHLAKLTNLEVLRLNDTKVTDAGLVRLTHLNRLRRLSLGPNVTRGGVARLRKALPNCRIEVFR